MRVLAAATSRLMLGACLLSMSGAALAAEIKATSKIDAVTVFPQGAEVTRTAKITLQAGEHAILLNDLPGQTIAASIRVEGKATGRLDIGSVDAKRTLVTSQEAAVLQSQRKKLEDEIERQRDAKAAHENTVKVAEAQRVYLENLAKLPATPVPAGAGGPREDWNAVFTVIGTRMAEAARTVTEARIRQREIDKTIADLQKELASVAPKQEDLTEVRINVTAAAPLESTLVVRYQIGQASWTPFYDARLATGDKATAAKMQLVRRAGVVNTSGEDWDDIALSLSTTRPGRTTAAPDLNMLSVDYEPEVRPVPAAPPPVAQTREGRVRAAAPAGGALEAAKAKDDRADATANEETVAQVSAAVTNAAFQAVFEIPGRTSVKRTGELKRVLIEQSEIDPQLYVRTVPRLDETAYLYARLTLPKTATPLLPGQVSLFRDGTFVGSGRLPQVSPGEEHQLGFGADDRVKVKRAVLEDKKGETGTFTTSRVEERNYRITAKSHHQRPIQIVVLDQVPVSAQQDIKVDVNFKGPQPTKRDVDDRRGTLFWELEAKPDEEKQIGFGYRVTWPNDKRITYQRLTPDDIRNQVRAKF
jgi:uncharacterized protein (TIGR02231 family)